MIDSIIDLLEKARRYTGPGVDAVYAKVDSGDLDTLAAVRRLVEWDVPLGLAVRIVREASGLEGVNEVVLEISA